MSRAVVCSLVEYVDKIDVLQMIKHGWEDEEILEAMPHIERSSISAYRAHQTRGTYSRGGRHNGKGRADG